MFTLDQPEFFPWPVQLKIPHNGSHKQFKLTINFNTIDGDEMREIFKDLAGKPPADGDAPIEPVEQDDENPDKVLCRRLIHGWGADVVGADGKPVEYNEGQREKLLRIYGAPAAIVRAWYEAVLPGVKLTEDAAVGKQS